MEKIGSIILTDISLKYLISMFRIISFLFLSNKQRAWLYRYKNYKNI